MTVSEGQSIRLACRALGVSESGFYDWRGRAPSPRAVRRAWSTDLIREIHVESFRVYGAPADARRVHPRSRITVGHNTIVLSRAARTVLRPARTPRRDHPPRSPPTIGGGDRGRSADPTPTC